ncbi:hypothetical protein [Thermomonas sp.]|uniref:hypothetical protein n=1 Tax=Thermomonas sp. TaxID=1971895 RepID=UPI0026337865|nr:hypothetical protein [Thermomonas sp.]
MRRAAFLLPLLFLGLARAPPAQTQVRRCVAANGNIVYTDRTCADLGATSALAPASPADGGSGGSVLRSMCARNVRDLAYGLESAIQSGDANRIASLYDWTGMPTSAAERLMDYFDRIATRTFVDLVPVYSSEDVAPAATPVPGTAAVPGTVPDPNALPAPSSPPSRRVVGLRVEQVLTDGHTPSQASFGVVKRMGCWWIRS